LVGGGIQLLEVEHVEAARQATATTAAKTTSATVEPPVFLDSYDPVSPSPRPGQMPAWLPHRCCLLYLRALHPGIFVADLLSNFLLMRSTGPILADLLLCSHSGYPTFGELCASELDDPVCPFAQQQRDILQTKVLFSSVLSGNVFYLQAML
jgi:hypothetical protein